MLDTPRLRLRRLTRRDADDYAMLVGDPEVMRFIGTGRAATLDGVAGAIDNLNARYEADRFGVLAIERRSDSRFIGRVGFWVWDRRDWTGGWTRTELCENAEVELGWALLRSVWGHGYATEASSAMRDFAFRQLGPDAPYFADPPAERAVSPRGQATRRDP